MEQIIVDIRAKREFQNALDSATHLGEKSKKQYTTAYKKMKNVLPMPIIKQHPSYMVECLRAMTETPPETKNQWITVMLMIYRYENENMDIDQLLFYRGKKVRNDDGTYKLVGGDLSNDINNWKLNKKVEVGSQLPTIEALKNHYETLFKQNDYRGYILNYLLVNLGIRNKDCNIIISSDKKIISTKSNNITTYTYNYLYSVKSYTWWVCNNYKTANTYGRKRLRIRDTKFQYAINQIYTGKDEYLLINKDGNHIAEASLSSYIQSRTYQNIGEGIIFKTIIQSIIKDTISQELKNKKIKLFSESRGTDVSTIIARYATDVPI